jgi:hypothetical protein
MSLKLNHEEMAQPFKTWPKQLAKMKNDAKDFEDSAFRALVENQLEKWESILSKPRLPMSAFYKENMQPNSASESEEHETDQTNNNKKGNKGKKTQLVSMDYILQDVLQEVFGNEVDPQAERKALKAEKELLEMLEKEEKDAQSQQVKKSSSSKKKKNAGRK